jgi:hypothetical protein
MDNIFIRRILRGMSFMKILSLSSEFSIKRIKRGSIAHSISICDITYTIILFGAVGML